MANWQIVKQKSLFLLQCQCNSLIALLITSIRFDAECIGNLRGGGGGGGQLKNSRNRLRLFLTFIDF